jgi:integrase
MPRFKITDAFIKKLKPPATGSKVYFADVPGFGVRISKGGTIAFVYNYRNSHGEDRRIKIGRYPAFSPTQARNRAVKLQNAVENGIDPLLEKQREQEAPTMGELIAAYQKDPDVLKKRPPTLRNERQMFKNIIKPHLATRRVGAITRTELATLHKSLEGTPYAANRVLALLSTVFTFAEREKWRADNPAKGIKKFPEEKRERWLTEDEMKRLSAALDSYSDQTAANAIRLLLLTGSRESEVLQATWEEFDLERGVWTKPSHHTKQKKTEHVALSDAALALLHTMHEHKKGTYLFPGRDGRKARVTIRRPWEQVCKTASLVEEFTEKSKRIDPRTREPRLLKRYRPTLRIHDLRHNFASYLVSSGVSLHIVGKLLGHTQPQTTARYAHLADNPLREAANKFGQILNDVSAAPPQ